MADKKKWIVEWSQFFELEAETKEVAEKIIEELKFDLHKLPWVKEPYHENLEAYEMAGR